MESITIEHIARPEMENVLPIAALEDEVFGRGGLNEWHLPVIARRGRLYAARVGGVVVGAVSIIRDWDPSIAFLVDLAVSPDWRRQGVGESLMATIIKELSTEGIKCLELTVAADNAAAVNLYEKLGFSTVTLWADEYGAGESRQLLRLDLPPTGMARTL